MKNKILVVDDDIAICELLTDVLSEHVFEVRSCHLAQSALQTLQQEPDIALVLLDLMLPDMSGLLLLQQIRMQFPDLPVIMLTGLATESDMIVGLEMGADDYIAKPFVPRIVVARVKAVLRRTPAVENPQRRMVAPVSGPGYRFDGWLLNTHTGRLHTPCGDDIELTQGEYSLLTVLLKNARKVLSALKCPPDSRRFVLDLAAEANALGLAAFANVDQSSDARVRIEGEVGRKYGFDFYSDQQVPVHTKGATTGTSITVSATTAAGLTALPIAGLTAMVDRWNAEVAEGDPVTVTLDDGRTFDSVTRSPAWLLGGHTPVVQITGIAGCYLLSRVHPRCSSGESPVERAGGDRG